MVFFSSGCFVSQEGNEEWFLLSRFLLEMEECGCQEGVGSSSTSGEQPGPAVLPACQVTRSAPDQALLCKQ